MKKVKTDYLTLKFYSNKKYTCTTKNYYNNLHQFLTLYHTVNF